MQEYLEIPKHGAVWDVGNDRTYKAKPNIERPFPEYISEEDARFGSYIKMKSKVRSTFLEHGLAETLLKPLGIKKREQPEFERKLLPGVKKSSVVGQYS